MPESVIRYSSHFTQQKESRSFPDGLAETILQHADNYYYDNAEHSLIAVKRVHFMESERDISLAYVERGNGFTFITIYPLKEGQQRRRVESGRWTSYDPEITL